MDIKHEIHIGEFFDAESDLTKSKKIIQILEDLCSELERNLNMRKEKPYRRTVTLKSGMHPSGYFLPQTYISSSDKYVLGSVAWFVELFVDKDCIFRESHVPNDSEDLDIVEGMLMSRLLRNIFTFGVMSSKKFIDEMK